MYVRPMFRPCIPLSKTILSEARSDPSLIVLGAKRPLQITLSIRPSIVCMYTWYVGKLPQRLSLLGSLVYVMVSLTFHNSFFFQAIELYRKANHFLEGARLLFDVAKAETAKHSRYEEWVYKEVLVLLSYSESSLVRIRNYTSKEKIWYMASYDTKELIPWMCLKYFFYKSLIHGDVFML